MEPLSYLMLRNDRAVLRPSISFASSLIWVNTNRGQRLKPPSCCSWQRRSWRWNREQPCGLGRRPPWRKPENGDQWVWMNFVSSLRLLWPTKPFRASAVL